ncbi:MAG: nucleotidyltransferase family protein [Alloprevotella sp.]
MNALILAAGLGTRLRPLTDHTPKALIEVEGKPLLFQAIERLKKAGATEIVVNVHYLGEQIIDYLSRRDWGIPVAISDERDLLLDTGGGIRKAAGMFANPDAPLLIHNVDILSNAALTELVKRAEEADAVLLVSRRETSRYLLFDRSMQLKAWTNCKTGEVRTPFPDLCPCELTPLAFSGIHVLAPRALQRMKEEPEKFSIIDFYLRHCDGLRLVGLHQENLQLLDVGKPDALEKAPEFLRSISEE